jgi:hypothetical protein
MLYDPGSWSRRKFIFTDEQWKVFSSLGYGDQLKELAKKKARGEYEEKK